MAQKVDFHEGKIGAFVKVIVALIKKNPQYLDNHEYLMTTLLYNMPELKRKDICPNCDASMKEYIYQFDALDALLLIAMAKKVRENRTMYGMTFTEANCVRVPELDVSHGIRCRTTQASKLGLVAEARTSGGMRMPGYWLVTRRGWCALRGDPVPKKVKVWRKRIEERFDEMTTIHQAMNVHVDYVEARFRKGKHPREDHRDTIKAFNAEEWLQFGTHEGNIF